MVPLAEQYLEKTSDIHMAEMPFDLASQLGKGVVREIFHRGVLEYDGGIGYVALHENKVVGLLFAQIDFARFSKYQHKFFFRYYSRVGMGLLCKPWLFPKALSAIQYLKEEPCFINLGPLAVAKEARTLDFTRRNGSVATQLNIAVFVDIANRSGSLPVLTMIRPDNILSVSSVIQGAKRCGYRLVNKKLINFSGDERIIYKFMRDLEI